MIQTVILGVVALLSIASLGFIVLVLQRLKVIGEAQSEHSAQNELRSLREEISRSEKEIRDEVRNTQAATTTTLVTNIGEFSSTLTTQVDGLRTTVDKRFQNLQQSIESRLDKIRDTVTNQLQSTAETLVNTVGELGNSQDSQLERVRKTVHDRLEAMQTSNEEKSENMYKTVTNQLQSTADTLVNTVGELGKTQDTQLENVRKTVHDRLEAMQSSNEEKSQQTQKTVTGQLKTTADTLVNSVGELGKTQDTQLENIRKTVHDRLEAMQSSNEKKLDQMRDTVDEKLQSTLEKRLGESFNQVSKRLEEVQRGLGEMQELATGVGDLKRVLTNVKTRGTWGEVQLGALLEEILTPEQYSSNVQVSEDSREEVEYAIRLPGKHDQPNSCVWLPIDSKFPLVDYERLVQSSEAADEDVVEKATATLLTTVRNEAKSISEKYIVPPKTTDFAIMFLPTEGLYAEVLRIPGEVSHLLHHYRIVVAGPTTLAAILSSLRMGFRTLAIEKRSSEVWEILAAVKTEFGKFGDVMAKLKKQLNTASNTVDQTQTRTRAMERQLQTVEQLPADEASARLGLTDGISEIHTTDTEELLE
ncbi:MAG: DNA recombination protein RmuC [Candidatus Poribacteria bacterium]|nr:DNA recombination protein RmuC [Candidatus Poribacteria bacterium]